MGTGSLEMWSGTLCNSSSSSSSSSSSGPADFYTAETACVKINLETLGQGCEDLCSA